MAKPENVMASSNVIYADKITSFAIGRSVVRLSLGVEVGPDTYEKVSTVVLPTDQFLQAIKHIYTKLAEDETIRNGILEGGAPLAKILNEIGNRSDR